MLAQILLLRGDDAELTRAAAVVATIIRQSMLFYVLLVISVAGACRRVHLWITSLAEGSRSFSYETLWLIRVLNCRCGLCRGFAEAGSVL